MLSSISLPEVSLLAAGFVLLAIALPFIQEWLSPLKNVPGPVAARFSRFWYLKHVWLGNFHKRNIKLHQQYGPVVRIAPGQYSIDDPSAVKIIYGSGKGFIKAPWYKASGDPNARFQDLFTDRDPVRHAANRRLVANLYSVTSLRGMESSVDECVNLFILRLSEHAKTQNTFDLQFWMQCYAFDVIGQITLAKRFGLLDKGIDKDDIFGNIRGYVKYCATVGVYSELHNALFWLMSKLASGGGGLAYVASFAMKQIEDASKDRKDKAKQESGEGGLDFLSKTLELHEKDPERFPLGAIHTTCLTNIGAGSDTTSISLCSVLFCLMNSPTALSKLRQEIDDKLVEIGSKEKIPYKDTQSMPYLQACIKEGLRLHPATGLPLARIVPEPGVTICGNYFRPGTIVGINTWVAHRNRAVFGADADDFRPERWLDQPKDKLSMMESYYMPFGAGSRTCIGKNISLLEINKLIPALVKKFDFIAQDPEKVTHENFWFVNQRNMKCKVMARE